MIDMAQYPEAIYIPSETGWQTQDSFMCFLEEFNKFIDENGHRKPCILWLDGHASHIGIDTAVFARDHDIHVMKFLPNATNMLQPFDVGVASAFKAAWSAAVDSFSQNADGKKKKILLCGQSCAAQWN